ncbi:MAG: PilZ domain-containing protein [Thermodesulfobacteriota bacterium]
MTAKILELQNYRKDFVQRSSKRIKLLRKIKFGIDDAVFPGKTYNFSESGLLIHSFKAFIPGTIININFFIENKVINLDAEVKWVTKAADKSGSFMGVKFAGNLNKLKKIYTKELQLIGDSVLKH